MGYHGTRVGLLTRMDRKLTLDMSFLQTPKIWVNGSWESCMALTEETVRMAFTMEDGDGADQ